MAKLACNAKRENSIIRKRILCLFITCIFFLSYFSAFVELAAISHRILHENGEIKYIHISPTKSFYLEAGGCDKASSTSFSEIPKWSICQIQKNLMNSRALSPDANCNQISPLDIIAFFLPSPSVEIAFKRDIYFLAPKNSPPIS